MDLDPFGVYATTGLTMGQSAPENSAPGAMPGIERSTGPTGVPVAGWQAAVSLHNPLTWFGIAAALTFGLIAISTTLKVGKAKVSVSTGKKK